MIYYFVSIILFMAGQPDAHHRAQELLKAAGRLESVIRGNLTGLTERLRVNKGRLSADDEANLRNLIGRTQGEVKQLIGAVLTTSAQFSGRQPIAPASPPPAAIGLGMTISDDEVLPLPEQIAPVKKSPPRMPAADVVDDFRRLDAQKTVFHPTAQFAASRGPSSRLISPTSASSSPEQPGGAINLFDAPEPVQRSFEHAVTLQAQEFLTRHLEPALAPKFEQLQFVARGGMGIIIKAYQPDLGRHVAIKLNTMVLNEKLVKNFLREGRHAASIGVEPNIVTVFETGQAKVSYGGITLLLPYHVMEFIDGAKDGDFLMEVIKEAGRPLPVDATLLLIKQYAEGLAAAHRKDIVHRDVKLVNVLVTPETQTLLKRWLSNANDRELVDGLQRLTKGLKVADFGLAGVRGQMLQAITPTGVPAASEGVSQTLTGEGGILGTPYYVPPEAYVDPNSAGKPWDAYSLGLVFYMLLTGYENPMRYSKEFDEEAARRTGPTYYVGKIGAHVGPAIALPGQGPGQDPELAKLIAIDPDAAALIPKLRELTNEDPAKRQSLEEFLIWLHAELQRRSPETKARKAAETQAASSDRTAQAARKAAVKGQEEVKKQRSAVSRVQKQVEREKSSKWKWVSGVIAVALLSATLYLGTRRPKEHNDFGALRSATATQLRLALGNSQTTGQQLNDLLARYQREEEHRPAGYEPLNDEKHHEPSEEELAGLKKHAQLIIEGEALLAQKHYAAARAKFDEAGEKERSEMSKRPECAETYSRGLRAYRMGQADQARNDFKLLSDLGMAGMDALTTQKFREYKRLLESWPAKQPELDRLARSFAESDPSGEQVKAKMEAAAQGDADAAAILIMARVYYKDNFKPQVLKDAEARGQTPAENRRKYGNDPAVVEYNRRLNMLRAGVFQLGEKAWMIAHYTGMDAGIEQTYLDDLLDSQRTLKVVMSDLTFLKKSLERETDPSKIPVLQRQLEEQKTSYRDWLYGVLHDLEDFAAFADHDGRGVLVPLTASSWEATMNGEIAAALNDALTQFSRGPNSEQATLLAGILENFPNNQAIRKQATSILGVQ